MARHYPSQTSEHNRVNAFERFCFEKRLSGYPAYSWLPKEVYPFDQKDTQRPLQPWSEGVQLKHGVRLGMTYMVLVLQACIMQELWGHGGVHPDFRRWPVKPDQTHVKRLHSLQKVLERVMHVALTMRLNLQWGPWEVRSARNME